MAVRSEALKADTFLGMTRDEAKVQEEGRAEITRLVQKLTGLVGQISQLHQ